MKLLRKEIELCRVGTHRYKQFMSDGTNSGTAEIRILQAVDLCARGVIRLSDGSVQVMCAQGLTGRIRTARVRTGCYCWTYYA